MKHIFAIGLILALSGCKPTPTPTPAKLSATPQRLEITIAKPSDLQSSAPTPMAEVARVIGLLPRPEIGFVDFGCGDARWCIAAAERWGCRVTGIEFDPARAAAREEQSRRQRRHDSSQPLRTSDGGNARHLPRRRSCRVAHLAAHDVGRELDAAREHGADLRDAGELAVPAPAHQPRVSGRPRAQHRRRRRFERRILLDRRRQIGRAHV